MNDGGMGNPFGPGMNSADFEDLLSAFGGSRFSGGGFGGSFAGFSSGSSYGGGNRRGHTHSFGF